jgi:outer membrane protein assembly factor BamA
VKVTVLHILLSCLMTAAGVAQDSAAIAPPEVPDSVWVVDTVVVVGNDHTKDFVIFREMSLRPGVPITRELLEYDKNRIYSLRLFNEVRIGVTPSTPGRARLIVAVSERWYIFPYPILGIRDRDWSKVFYGAGIIHTNFRGRNEKLGASLVLGYDPSVSLSYRNPFLHGDGSDFISVGLSFNKVRNKSLIAQLGADNFDERHYTISIDYGRRFGIEHTVWIEGGYEAVEVSDYAAGRTLSADGTDRFPVARVGYTYDTRDLGEYPASGMLIAATISKFGFPSGIVDNVRYSIDFRQYVPLAERTVWTARVFSALTAAGQTPSYNRVYFGYGDRIRGHFKDVLEGENIFGASTELHFTLLSPHYLRVGALPSSFGVWRFGLVAAAFADAGTAWFRTEPFSLHSFARGYGLGLDFLLPYSTVIRCEYAWNERRRGEFILDAGASF